MLFFRLVRSRLFVDMMNAEKLLMRKEILKTMKTDTKLISHLNAPLNFVLTCILQRLA